MPGWVGGENWCCLDLDQPQAATCRPTTTTTTNHQQTANFLPAPANEFQSSPSLQISPLTISTRPPVTCDTLSPVPSAPLLPLCKALLAAFAPIGSFKLARLSAFTHCCYPIAVHVQQSPDVRAARLLEEDILSLFL
ncbi:hypothetical protein PAAG_12220 [Paracoccidioides lutzii Pb01]|uniref:Uncharacterized protein n=1 Tax=Paracoccidioides lutzii (strain ATCC MYA-826 / Pb01) TaxID=502779 RepID=A0A0A2V0R6_PARBA|nr:hypothetical protein PAAG_12220 [Paracoccidioides lutzii Pb01]KGQ01093.1 hypothetical protein PAAG_12220 [Paracoccidioides lutzii Pb01]